ncbi:hypothetical protein FAZ15_00585 [Sphingobacterium olei]|uniref:DUF2946 domain-containing protein n=1 Tax=Sphingobacterium olei TaxID=2571155 RepID=A0A4U0P5X9_9SPHI|nr:hypothetical protein [Sphingobacterium olei]TJZ62841.1 hypothetical protein FAZ15_00585 [Sphingobacterium olei]
MKTLKTYLALVLVWTLLCSNLFQYNHTHQEEHQTCDTKTHHDDSPDSCAICYQIHFSQTTEPICHAISLSPVAINYARIFATVDYNSLFLGYFLPLANKGPPFTTS